MSNHSPSLYSVSELTQAIKGLLEPAFPSITVQGEVSNFKRQDSGHLYFSLKDSGASIAAVMFRADASRLSLMPKEGDKVICSGSVTLYPPSGRYQIVVREIKLSGLGEKLLALEELKKKLHQKGWFLKEHKLPLPPFPKCIGVVTSPTGAAIHDILNVLTRRSGGFRLILNPVRVQGTEAPQEIVQAIKQFNTYQLADVLIVGRGGGSIEDLWAFNEESVAEAIFSSRIPIISAVGHESDTTLADYVASLRAPTPSAAAEIVTKERCALNDRLLYLSHGIKRTFDHGMGKKKLGLERLLKHPLLKRPTAFLERRMQDVDEMKQKINVRIEYTLHKRKILMQGLSREVLVLKPSNRIPLIKKRLQTLEKGVDQAMQAKFFYFKQKLLKEVKEGFFEQCIRRLLVHKKAGLDHLHTTLQSINPKNVLRRGYSIVFAEKTQSVIKSVSDLSVDQKVNVLFHDGEAGAKILHVRT